MAGGFCCYEVSDNNIWGRDTSKHPFDAPKHICPQCEYILWNRKSKIVKNVIFCNFGSFCCCNIVDFCTFDEEVNFDQRRYFDDTGIVCPDR